MKRAEERGEPPGPRGDGGGSREGPGVPGEGRRDRPGAQPRDVGPGCFFFLSEYFFLFPFVCGRRSRQEKHKKVTSGENKTKLLTPRPRKRPAEGRPRATSSPPRPCACSSPRAPRRPPGTRGRATDRRRWPRPPPRGMLPSGSGRRGRGRLGRRGRRRGRRLGSTAIAGSRQF